MEQHSGNSEPVTGASAYAIGAGAALFLLFALVFMINSPVADREAQPGEYNPATATLQCGRPLMHDLDGLRGREWSAPPVGRDGSDEVLPDDVAVCLELVDEHRTRAWVSGGIAAVLAAVTVGVVVRDRRLSRRPPA